MNNALGNIVQRMQQGEREAFGLFYSSCSERLRTLCLHFVPNEAVADDLLHDAFVLMFTRIGDLKEPSKAESWAATVVRNVCLLYLREQRQRPTVSLSEAESTVRTMAVEPASVGYDELLQLVDLLPEGYARVFRLSVLDGLTHQQIAALLGIEPHTSSSQLYRAKLALRRMLRPLVLLLAAALLPAGLWLWKRQPSQYAQESPAIPAIPTTPTTPIVPIVPIVPTTPTTPTTPIPPITIPTPPTAASADTLPVLAQQPPPQPVTPAEDSLGGQPTNPVTLPIARERKSAPAVARKAHASSWSVALAYSGLSNSSYGQLPVADANTNADACDTITHHQLPLTWSLSLRYRLDDHWQVGTGLTYTRFVTEQQIGNSLASLCRRQRVGYLGIPVSLTWQWSGRDRPNRQQSGRAPSNRQRGGRDTSRPYSVYATASVTLHLPLRSTLSSHYALNCSPVEPTTTERLHPGVQWSVGLGVGAEYRLAPHMGFFVEPTLQHCFQNGSGIETWSTAHPLTFSLPIGLRLSW